MPLLYNHLLDSCIYVCKNTLLAKRRGGGSFVRKRKRAARVAKRREGRGRGEEERSGEGRGGGEDGRRGAKELMNLL